jgi:hypothetical protein
MKQRSQRTYTLSPNGLLDRTSAHVMQHAGAEVRKVQPYGCPKNGTMRQCYVERVDTGEFIGLVNESSLVRS